jgi:hypothetical protein
MASPTRLDERLRGIDGGDVPRAESPNKLSRHRPRTAADVERSLPWLDSRGVGERDGEWRE